MKPLNNPDHVQGLRIIKPTLKFRWLVGHSDLDGPKILFVGTPGNGNHCVLQQCWVDNEGEVVWRDIEIAFDL